MSDPVELLDAVPDAAATGAAMVTWMATVERSLAEDEDSWLDLPDGGALTERRAWALLAWAEEAAAQVVREPRGATLEHAAFVLSLLEGSPLDRREAFLVGMLVHRGADLAGLAYAPAVRAGCARAGTRGRTCLGWLTASRAATPSTHAEVGQGPTFAFRRLPATFDVEALERWAKGE